MAGRRPYAAELSKHDVDILLGLYSGCECLWNMQCPEYTQRNAKQAAFRSIVNGMRLETGIFLTADQVIAKIRNIRAQYGRELKKTLESDKTGTPYRSQWRWFNFLDSFLRSHFPKKDDDDDDISEVDKEAEKDVEVTGTPASAPPIKGSADDSDNNADEIDDISDSVSDAPAANSSTSAPVQNLSFTRNRDRPQAKCRPPQNHHPISLRSHDPKPQSKVVGPASTAAMRLTNDVSLQSVTPDRTRKRSRSSAFGPAVPLNSPGGERMPSVPASLSHTLHLMQTLMATTLSSQDHPSFVFAKHISNELDLITDYRRRKKCMLAIQEVILQYQMQEDQTAAVKDERVGETRAIANSVIDSLKSTEAKSTQGELESQKNLYEKRGSGFQIDDEDDTPVHFEMPAGSSSNNTMGGIKA